MSMLSLSLLPWMLSEQLLVSCLLGRWFVGNKGVFFDVMCKAYQRPVATLKTCLAPQRVRRLIRCPNQDVVAEKQMRPVGS